MTIPETRILLIDDDTGDAFLAREALARIDKRNYEIEHASSLTEAQGRLSATDYDVVLLDLNLPESMGVDTLRRLRSLLDQDVPVIVLTGMDDEDAALQMLVEGAADFLCKSEISAETLSRSIQYTLRRQKLLAELHSANQLLKQKNARLAQLYDTAQQFVDNVSHEFRTPLTVIREYASIIRDGLDGPVTEKQTEHLEKVLHRTDDLALMVDDMLDISKLESGLLAVWRRPCQASDLVADVESMIRSRADSRGIRFTIEVEPHLPDVFCDEEKARRVIINLAINAIKFTPERGAVRLWVRKDDRGVVIGVTDSGAGISETNLNEIFKRFRQVETGVHSSTKGFGLGLSIAKELVELNLGLINVESTPGVGSTFSFTLPAHNVDDVVERYLERVLRRMDDQAELSVLTVSIDGNLADDSGAVVDEFVQRALRGNDLALRLAVDRWVLITHCPQAEVGDAMDRILADWHSFTRNCPAVELPALECQPIGSWMLPGELNCFRKAVRNQQTSSQDKPASEGETQKPSVLVVDDNADVSTCLSVRLEAAGYEVLTAFDGEAGLAAALQTLPDAVVLDVCMPKRDGLSVLRELRSNQKTKDTPIVMLSASIRDQHGALEAGADFFVPKPYESGDVLSAIESSMNRSVAQSC